VISCLGTGNETMKFLHDEADLNLDQELVKKGSIGTCVWPNNQHKPCRGVHSSGVHVCTGEFLCAGAYQTLGYEHLELPSGWVWSSYDKSVCFLTDPQDLYCGIATGVITVTPTD
jgi:hypothetical protein